MAIGGPTVSSVQDALEAGVFVVAAAGNQGENSSDVSTPASIKQVIAVGAVDRGGIVWEDTSKGAISMDGEIREDPHKKPEISAPGMNVISTNDPEFSIPYASSSGTSVSTVFVVGSLALILEKHGVDSLVFARNLAYYMKHPSILENVYTNIIDTLVLRESTIRNK